MHFNMIEQRRAIFPAALEIQVLSFDGNRPRRALGIQQQKEREHQWDVMRHASEGFANDLIARRRIQRALSIVSRPAIVKAKSNPFEEFGHAGIVAIDAAELTAQHGFGAHVGRKAVVENNVRLQWRHDYVGCAHGVADAPESPRRGGSARRAGLQQQAHLPAVGVRVLVRHDGALTDDFLVNGIAPLDPNETRRYSQQIKATRQPVALREGQLGARPGEIIGKDKSTVSRKLNSEPRSRRGR